MKGGYRQDVLKVGYKKISLEYLWEDAMKQKAFEKKRRKGKYNLLITHTARQEAQDHLLKNAKTCAKCWNHFLKHTKVHIRRGYIVTAHIQNVDDFLAWSYFAIQVNLYREQMQKQAITNNQ